MVRGIKDNKEKLKKLLNKKHRLEKFIEEKVREKNRKAKDQLERKSRPVQDG